MKVTAIDRHPRQMLAEPPPGIGRDIGSSGSRARRCEHQPERGDQAGAAFPENGLPPLDARVAVLILHGDHDHEQPEQRPQAKQCSIRAAFHAGIVGIRSRSSLQIVATGKWGQAPFSSETGPDPISIYFASGGPLNSDSSTTSTSSPTPMFVPGSGMPIDTPKSERLNLPRAEKPMRAFGSMGWPA